MDLEKSAEKAYADLAAQIIDPQGHEMFTRRSMEERDQYRILDEALRSLTNTGVWKIPHP